MAQKASKRLDLIKPLKMKLDRVSLQRLYYSIIKPVMEYGSIIWHIPNDRSHLLDSLESVQTNAARLDTGAATITSSASIYNETKWETLSQRRNNQ
jgi:hypothetical protein